MRILIGSADHQIVMPMHQWVAHTDPSKIVIEVFCEGEPVSKARARMGDGGNFYTPKKTASYEERLGWEIKIKLGSRECDSFKTYGVICIFRRSSRHRIDVDNLTKCVLDAATGIVWKDDNQVSEICSRIELGCEKPNSNILIYESSDTRPTAKCKNCGEQFTQYKSTHCKFCSQDCFRKSRRIDKVCLQCNGTFSVPISVLKTRVCKFCSQKCSRSYHGEKKTRLFGPQTWICADCGKHTSRKEYKRCRLCYMSKRETHGNYWKLRKVA